MRCAAARGPGRGAAPLCSPARPADDGPGLPHRRRRAAPRPARGEHRPSPPRGPLPDTARAAAAAGPAPGRACSRRAPTLPKFASRRQRPGGPDLTESSRPVGRGGRRAADRHGGRGSACLRGTGGAGSPPPGPVPAGASPAAAAFPGPSRPAFAGHVTAPAAREHALPPPRRRRRARAREKTPPSSPIPPPPPLAHGFESQPRRPGDRPAGLAGKPPLRAAFSQTANEVGAPRILRAFVCNNA